MKGEMEMEFICDYMRDGKKRAMLNELTRKTFWFDFEDWVSGDFYTGDYIPYSLEENGKLISNISANIMAFNQNGIRRNYIQLGTVMTDENFRRRGLARSLMERVLSVYEGKCDGIYLFGNLDALDFYRKMGFSEMCEYQYTLKESVERRGMLFEKIQKSELPRYEMAIRASAVNSAFEQVNKYGLQMFYTAGLDNVYYARDIDCYAVFEKDGDVLTLSSIVSRQRVRLEEVIARIPEDYAKLVLGFAPLEEDASLFSAEIYDGAEDYRLFYRGEAIKSIEREKLYFPVLSHA